MDKVLTTVLLGLVATTVLTTFNVFSNTPLDDISNMLNSSEIQAYDLAVSGVEYAMEQLEADGNWAGSATPTRVRLDGLDLFAAPTATADPFDMTKTLANARFITSRALVGNSEVTVQAIVDRPLADALPNALHYALYTGDKLRINDQLLVQDYGNLLRNTNVHTNGYLGIQGAGLIQGYGTYSSGFSAEEAPVAAVFHPNINEGGSGVYRHPTIDMPSLNEQNWKKLAQRTYASSTTPQGDINIGTADEPGVWLIRGHCNLRGNIRGSGVLLVEGDLRLYANEERQLLREKDEHLCIVVKGNVFAENAKVNANIISGGSFFGSGGVILIGSLVAHGDVQNIGTMDIYYRPVADEVASIVWEPGPQPPRIAMFYD